MATKEYMKKKIPGRILLEVLSGSHSYGLNTPQSDEDIRGVYVQPTTEILKGNYVPQISDDTNDVTYYEVGRFIELLQKGNPNILEILNTPLDCIRKKESVFDIYFSQIVKKKVLTKRLKETFYGYAVGQLRRAKGLNKKINKPMGKRKKTLHEFCYIIRKEDGFSMPLNKWIKKESLHEQYIGLSRVSNGVEFYKVYYDWVKHVHHKEARAEGLSNYKYKGVANEKSNSLLLSTIPKEAILEAFLWYNKDGYSIYCKQYKEYWDWVEKRNEHRYQTNISTGFEADTKNMMHTMRLLLMAEDIATGKGIVVRRPEVKFLLGIRNGSHTYDELISMAEGKKDKLELLFSKSGLPNTIDEKFFKELLLKIRLDEL